MDVENQVKSYGTIERLNVRYVAKGFNHIVGSDFLDIKVERFFSPLEAAQGLTS